LKKSDRKRIEDVVLERKCLAFHDKNTVFNDSVLPGLGLERELMGRVAKLKLQYFWPHYSGKCRTVGTYSPRRKRIMEESRHRGRPRRQWIRDIEEWTGCEYIQLKETSQDRAQWRRKISEWSSAVANPHRGRSTSE